MKTQMIAMTALAAVSLASCGQSAPTAPYPTAAATPVAGAPAAAPAAAAPVGPVAAQPQAVAPVAPVAPMAGAPALTPQYLTGTWSDDPACVRNAATFTADGGYVANGQRIPYQIVGPNQVMLVGPNGRATVQITPVDQNTIVAQMGDQVSRASRCQPGAGMAGAPGAR